SFALTDTERATVLDAHNNYRQSVASGNAPNKDGTKLPQAADMNKLVYDTGIEAIAQKWAANCKFDHSSAAERNNTGENLYMAGGKQDLAAALKGASDLWWGELAEYGVNTTLTLTMEEFNRGIGHWSQMAWAKTTRIGCGVQQCSIGTIVVCNYAPSGNYLNQKIYTAGTACSKCASGTSCANSLCA
ncbi:venom allergen-like protein vap-2, partial [Aphelenchoides avenae]